ncbi:replicative DNA helicase [Endomicrobiia bacterium]|nr:replicative DNA helicase [Endomicrobiia bacterium]GHT11511.1 replicative DNA helicase [Endomicrobiia bacterium]GHT21280.1 replicative DNA helicase [Endomicrobiia bacterium]GHT27509.1 replicative DNA helicase [Endomicrobiia bacterium]GHT29397.1 replicative DNA helicase [Endomicrobiia bacterium]
MANIIEKVSPQAVDVEMSVLGAMLIEKEAILKVMDIINENDFYKEIHRQIFLVINDLYIGNHPVDLLIVSEALKKNAMFSKVGGTHYLTELIDSVHTAANAEHYASIIRDKSISRQLINIGSAMVSNAFNEQNTPDEILDKFQAALFNVSQQKGRKGFSSVSKLVRPMLQKLEKLHSNPKEISGLSTGFADFDSKTTGFHPSELVIIAARPSMGKTAFALNIAEHVAVVKKNPVAIFSLEMKQEALMIRFLASLARVNIGRLRNGQYNSTDWPRLTGAAEKIAGAPIFIDDDSNISVIELRIRARKLATELKTRGERLALIIIDYIQFIHGSGRKFESRQQEVSDISRSLKALAKDLDVPVVVLSQLSRRTEDRGRKDNKPQLSDLRDSGAIEQDADVVAMLYREGYYNREDPDLQRKAILIIGKQRNGPTGDINLIFEGEYTKFSDESKVQDDYQ